MLIQMRKREQQDYTWAGLGGDCDCEGSRERGGIRVILFLKMRNSWSTLPKALLLLIFLVPNITYI